MTRTPPFDSALAAPAARADPATRAAASTAAPAIRRIDLLIDGPLPLQGQNGRTPGQQVVVAAGARRPALVEELQVAGIDGHRLIGVGAHQIAVADVIGPGGAA